MLAERAVVERRQVLSMVLDELLDRVWRLVCVIGVQRTDDDGVVGDRPFVPKLLCHVIARHLAVIPIGVPVGVW